MKKDYYLVQMQWMKPNAPRKPCECSDYTCVFVLYGFREEGCSHHIQSCSAAVQVDTAYA